MRYPLTIQMCAERAGVSPPTIYSALRNGALKGRQFGRRRLWRISTEDFRAWCDYRHTHGKAKAHARRKLDPERIELEAQHQAQEKAYRRFLADEDHEGATIVKRALALTAEQLATFDG